MEGVPMSPDKVSFEQQWRGGRVRVETHSVRRLVELVEELGESGAIEESTAVDVAGKSERNEDRYPAIPGNLGCSDAILALLATDWGVVEGRTEAELTAAMRSNAIRFSHGTISGSLTAMTQKNKLRRIGKKSGSYSYMLSTEKIHG
jgi:hypothetical protein